MTKDHPAGLVTGLFTGKVAHPWDGREPTAIAKAPQHGPVHIGPLGLDGDEQADTRVHGGHDQAVHHYADEHHTHWVQTFAEDATRFHPGNFGENISSTGLTEETLCIGDVLSIGTAIVQVTQGRQPCWKLNAHIGREDMAYQFRKTARTGWYYRVIEPGKVSTGDRIELQERPLADWTIADVTRAHFAARLDMKKAAQLAALEPLSARWRESFRAKADAKPTP
ncbi:MAG: MOSC domain-containing protein [Pseudomonadota bacterium]